MGDRLGPVSPAPPVCVTDLTDRRTIAVGPAPDPERVLRPSFDGQDPTALLKQVPHRGTTLPPRLDVITLPRGTVWFGPGVDGIALTAEGRPVAETAMFARGDATVPAERLRQAIDIEEDWVTVVDCGWDNHYHLLTLALPKLPFARRHLPEAVVVIPARRAAPAADGRPAMLDQCLALDPDDGRVRPVADGLYRPRNLHLIWPNHRQAAALHLIDGAFAYFDTLARSVPPAPGRGGPRRIFIERVRDTRLLDPHAVRSLDRLLARHGFEKVRLEALDMAGQIRLFAGATHVVAAHGAGLSNIVFGSPRLRVLELNLDLDGGGTLRPWFLLLAAGRGQHYQYLNASACELADLTLGLAFDRLMGTRRQAARLRLLRLRGRIERTMSRWTGRAGA